LEVLKMVQDLNAQFDGSGKIEVPSAPAYCIGPLGSKTFTVSVIVCMSTHGTVLSWNGPDSGTGGMMGWILSIDQSGNIKFLFTNDDEGNWNSYLSSTASVLDGQWHQIIVMWDKGILRMYEDDLLLNLKPPTSLRVPSDSSLIPAFHMGWTPISIPGQIFLPFRGDMEDVIFFQQVLSSNQLTACRLNLITGKESNLVGLWRLDDNCKDESCLQNHGEVQGAVKFVPCFHTIWNKGSNCFSYVTMQRQFYQTARSMDETYSASKRAEIEATPVSREQKLNVLADTSYLAFTIYGVDGTYAYPLDIQCVIKRPDGITISTDIDNEQAYIKMHNGSPWQVLISKPLSGIWTLYVTGTGASKFSLDFQTFPSKDIQKSLQTTLTPCYPLSDSQYASTSATYESHNDFLFSKGAGVLMALIAANQTSPSKMNSSTSISQTDDTLSVPILIPILFLILSYAVLRLSEQTTLLNNTYKPNDPGRYIPSIAGKKRLIYYVTEFTKLDALIQCAEQNYLTHVLIGLFHLGYDNESRKTGPYIHLNNLNVTDQSYCDLYLWDKIKILQDMGVKVLASLGGGGVGDYTNLFNAYDKFYPLLKNMLKDYKFDGIDLDIEESNDVVSTSNITRLVNDLKRDIPNGSDSHRFTFTSTPVASALLDQRYSESPNVNYLALIDIFNFYILQFYNGFGDFLKYQDFNDSFKRTFNKPVPKFFVAGILTNSLNGSEGYYPLSTVETQINQICFLDSFGGICGWNYQNALDKHSDVNQVGWASTINDALTGCIP
jgi:hypothetical protein